MSEWQQGAEICDVSSRKRYLTSTPQGLDIAKDALITFCFARVSCDIQIRQLINDIKCASALADCVPLSRSATAINIRILLKATFYFSPSLHYVWIFTSRIFLNPKKIEWTTEFIIVWNWNYDYDNTHRLFCGYLITNIITELVIKILEMNLRFIRTITSFKIHGPCYLYSFLGPLCEERGGHQNRPSLYADVVGNPREDSHIKVKGMLVGKLQWNPWGRPMWVWLKLKLTLKGDFCEVSVTAIFCNFFHFCVGVPPRKQIIISSTWFFVRSMITVSWEYWLCFSQFRLRWMTGFMVRSKWCPADIRLLYLGEAAWTSTLYFLTFTEVARFEINVETLLFACQLPY